jgi:hypothetical protein
MSVATQQVYVPDRSALDQTITGYIAQGFTVQNRGDDFATLFKKKEFSVLWAVVGFLVCIIPLLVYLIVYATQKDQLVEIRIGETRELPGTSGATIHWSDDGRQWFDGKLWVDSRERLPESVQVSADRSHFWDGATWRPIPEELPDAELEGKHVFGEDDSQ